MDSRRDFLKKAAMLSGAAGITAILPESIQKAFAINPATGSTYLDAEHVVILMQENRSFDHCFGALQGVRGFNDPRAITLPDKNLVWLQTNSKGETYAPFRLNLKDTKSTWMSSLPHSWENQVDARNDGKYDKWLDVKKSGNAAYEDMPLTMGYYNREDIPFYYALADAFTVCDQNFCSSLTGTTPNRLYLWTGTIRQEQNEKSKANVRNEDVDYEKTVNWKTFPERLEENNISWKIYQNELSLPMGFTPEEEAWLANFTDNPVEWFEQYHVRFSKGFNQFLEKSAPKLREEISVLKTKISTLAKGEDLIKAEKELSNKETALKKVEGELKKWTKENFDKLSQKEKNLHEKAFTTNIKDPDYHQVSRLKYQDNDSTSEVAVPKGDVLYQFRDDVKTGNLPTVSWIVAPENFSDHPGAPWYGAWYLSEVMDILTQKPEVWKKTIFILAYDENDGYFDHVPPFVPPHPDKANGKASSGIDLRVEHVTSEQEEERKKQRHGNEGRESPIGLGYRVPLLVASPWSRGGFVCSEVFDHTSILQFLEKLLSHKTGKTIKETNISTWRRTICGDLTSVFRPYNGEKIASPSPLSRDTFIQTVHQAKNKKLPSDYRKLSGDDIKRINEDPFGSGLIPLQEDGIRPSCALPYEMYVNGNLSPDKKIFSLFLESAKTKFKDRTLGAPFVVYSLGKYSVQDKNGVSSLDELKAWNYTVSAGDRLTDDFELSSFENKQYGLKIYGPNGFYRQFTGNSNDPDINIECSYVLQKKSGSIQFKVKNLDKKGKKIIVIDNAYKRDKVFKPVNGEESIVTLMDLGTTSGWYDFSVKIEGFELFEQRFAGHIETGLESTTDPFMGRVKA